MIKIEKKYHFYMGHRNKEAGIKCGRLHGHTYDVVCTFAFNTMTNGVTMLFSDIDNKVEPIVKQYDHYFLFYEKDPLVDVLRMEGELIKTVPFETSAENMAIWLFKEIKNEAKLPIIKIELSETKSSTVIYEE
mgnify:CR=1 FL=1|tara:strand:- start:111 stop:509 length:399 start_codon:yes stop_codon:yes gene_type:complete